MTDIDAARAAADEAGAVVAEARAAKNEVQEALQVAKAAVKDALPAWDAARAVVNQLEAVERAAAGAPPPQQVGG